MPVIDLGPALTPFASGSGAIDLGPVRLNDMPAGDQPDTREWSPPPPDPRIGNEPSLGGGVVDTLKPGETRGAMRTTTAGQMLRGAAGNIAGGAAGAARGLAKTTGAIAQGAEYLGNLGTPLGQLHTQLGDNQPILTPERMAGYNAAVDKAYPDVSTPELHGAVDPVKAGEFGGELAPAMLSGPAAPIIMAAQGAGSAQQQIAAQRASGHPVGSLEELFGTIGNAVANALTGHFLGKAGNVAPGLGKAVNALASGGASAAVGAGGTVAGNVIAKSTFDPNRDVFEGVPESAAGGFLLGGATAAFHGASKGSIDLGPSTVSPGTETPPTPVSEPESTVPAGSGRPATKAAQELSAAPIDLGPAVTPPEAAKAPELAAGGAGIKAGEGAQAESAAPAGTPESLGRGGLPSDQTGPIAGGANKSPVPTERDSSIASSSSKTVEDRPVPPSSPPENPIVPQPAAERPAAAPAEQRGAKEPWQITKDAYINADPAIDAAQQALDSVPKSQQKKAEGLWRRKLLEAGVKHKTAVDEAMRAGKAVPADVLADYSDLTWKNPKPREPAPSPAPPAEAGGKTEQSGADVEFTPPEPPKTESPSEATSQPPADTTGIAHRVSEARGMPAERGQGISTEDSLERGRQLIKQGADPDQIVREHAETGKISADAMAAVRARGEQLAKATNAAVDANGRNSPEAKAAWQAEKDWIAKIKPMQTEWHKIGQAQQGETEIDTGTFHGLQRAYAERTGKDFTDSQARTAERVAAKVKAATDATEAAKQKLYETAGVADPRVKSLADRIVARLDKAADDALARWRARSSGRLTAGIDPLDVADLSIYGAAKIAKGLTKFADWSVSMLKDIGGGIRPHLQQLFDASNKHLDEHIAGESLKEPRAGRTLTDEQRLALAKKAALTAQEKAQQKVDTGDFSVQKRTPISNPEIDAIRAKTAELRKQITEGRSAQAAEEKSKAADELIKSHPPGTRMTPERVKALWAKAKTDYIEKGVTDLTDIVHKMSIDTGLSVNDIRRGLGQLPDASRLSNDMYAKQSRLRDAQNAAKRWVLNANTPGILRAVQSVPGELFALKVAGHGTVGMVTHAGNKLFSFDAPLWAKNFARQFRLIGSRAYHEQMMQDMAHDPDYITAKRGGLAIDVNATRDDYQTAGFAKLFGRLGLTGNRGFDALKLFRLGLFKKQWNSLPESLKTPEMAKDMSLKINHATGYAKNPVGEGVVGQAVNAFVFAPKLEASRWGYLIGDPAKAAKTFVGWRGATPVEKYSAMSELKQKATAAGLYFGALAANQALLKATGSDDKINYTDPTSPDWLSFKGAGHNVGVVGPMIGAVRYLVNLGMDSAGPRDRLKGDSRFEKMSQDTGKYLRYKLSPFGSVAMDAVTQSDYQGRPMPFSNDPVPKYLQREGIGPIGYGEYATQTALPIPVESALKEVWKQSGVSDATINTWVKAITIGAASGATGAHISEEFDKPQPPPRKTLDLRLRRR